MKRIFGIPELLLIYLVFFIFFLCTLASNFSGPHDSIGYLNGIVKGTELFHQHHLLYHFVAHYWLVGINALFPGVPDYFLVEAFTALWGSGSLTIAYCILRKRFGISTLLSLIATSVIAFSYGMWFYSVNIEVYAPSIFFLLAALYKLTDRNFSQNDVWKVVLLHCGAILFHQIHILFTITVLIILYQHRKKIKLVSALAQYVVMGVVLVGGAYFIVGWVIEGQDSVAKWVYWLKGYAAGDAYWRTINAKTPVYVATGLSHAFIGGHFVFGLPGAADYINKASGGRSLTDEQYLVRNMDEGLAIFLSILTLALAVVMIWLVVRFFRKYKSVRKSWLFETRPLLITGIVYSIFFCFWEPEILEFWIFQTVLFWLVILGTLLHNRENFPLRMKPIVAVSMIAGLLFIINFFGSVRYLMNLENDLYYMKTLPVKNAIGPHDGVLLQDGWILKDFLEYYTNAEVKAVPRADSARARVDDYISDHLEKGTKIYIYPEARHGYDDRHYVDSVLAANPGRISIFHNDNPKIIVIE